MKDYTIDGQNILCDGKIIAIAVDIDNAIDIVSSLRVIQKLSAQNTIK